MGSSKPTSTRSAKKHPVHARRKESLSPPTAVEKRILLAVALFVLFRLAATIFIEPGARVWGLDFARFILSPLTMAALAIPLLATLPSVAQRLGNVISPRPLYSNKKLFWLFIAAFTGGIILLIGSFPVAYSFLGDGAFCHTEVFRIRTVAGHVSPMFDKVTAFGTGQIIRAIIDIFEFNDNRFPFTVLGYMGIVILIPGLFFILRREPVPQAALLIIVLLFSPAILFFFGYVETYALQYVFLALFFAAAYASFARNGAWLMPAIFLAVSIALGVSSAIFIPALVILYAHSRGATPARLVKLTIILCAIVAFGFAGAILAAGGDLNNNVIIPLQSGGVTLPMGEYLGETGYSLFSPAHILDIANLVLFIAGPLLFAGIGAYITSRRGGVFTSPPVLFAIAGAAGGICMLLGGNAMFGLARDWDLAMIPATGIAFLLAVLLIELGNWSVIRFRIILPALALAALSGASLWVGINALPASATRLETLVDMDAPYLLPRNTSYGYESIRKYAVFRKNDRERLRITRKMLPIGINTMDLLDAGIAYSAYLEDADERALELSWYFNWLASQLNVERDPSDYRYVPKRLINEYLASSIMRVSSMHPEFAQMQLDSIHAKQPGWPLYPFVQRMIDSRKDTNGMVEATRASIPLDTQDSYLLAFGGGYMRSAKLFDEAAVYLETSLIREPHRNPQIYFMLSYLYEYDLRMPKKAIATLQRCLDSCKLAPQRFAYADTLAAFRQRHRIME